MGKAKEVARLLLENRGDDNSWEWLVPGKAPTMKDANKFFLGAILQWQISAEVAWSNARRFSEEILCDPDNLWAAVASVPFEDWKLKKGEYGLHWLHKGHERVWTIGRRINQWYGGDARRIWQGQSVDAVLDRLGDLRAGSQISKMIVGALKDTGQVSGRNDVKVDTHVCRVLGRVFRGKPFDAMNDAGKVVELTGAMHPADPWLLDRPLHLMGQLTCRPKEPKCEGCYLRHECVYHGNISRGAPSSK